MIKQSYPTAFPLKHQQKDIRLAIELGWVVVCNYSYLFVCVCVAMCAYTWVGGWVRKCMSVCVGICQCLFSVCVCLFTNVIMSYGSGGVMWLWTCLLGTIVTSVGSNVQGGARSGAPCGNCCEQAVHASKQWRNGRSGNSSCLFLFEAAISNVINVCCFARTHMYADANVHRHFYAGALRHTPTNAHRQTHVRALAHTHTHTHTHTNTHTHAYTHTRGHELDDTLTHAHTC